MSLRDDLLAAIDAGDHQAVHRLGWTEPWENLATSNAPRQSCTLLELRPYVKSLANEDVADILEALDACAGEWRPVPGELRAYLNRKHGTTTRVDVGRCSDPAATREALQACADAARAGEPVCKCGAPTARPWHVDALGVLRCPEGHLEQGQVFQAEDLGLLEAA